MKRRIIGLVGMQGSGKTTVAEYLKKKGYRCITLSSYIHKEALRRGYKQIDKLLLQDIGNDMRQKHGGDILARQAYQDVSKQHDKLVIDGIRNIKEISFLKNINGFLLIAIESDPKKRYARIIKRQTGKKTVNFDRFSLVEKREITLGDRKLGLRVDDCMKKADIKVVNNTTLKHLFYQIDKALLLI